MLQIRRLCDVEARRLQGKALTPQRRLQIEQIANQYGPPNCWTGTTGTLAAIIRELLQEIDVLTQHQ